MKQLKNLMIVEMGIHELEAQKVSVQEEVEMLNEQLQHLQKKLNCINENLVSLQQEKMIQGKKYLGLEYQEPALGTKSQQELKQQKDLADELLKKAQQRENGKQERSRFANILGK